MITMRGMMDTFRYASETHTNTDGGSNEPRIEIEERAASIPRKIGSVDPVQPNLWNNLDQATHLNPDIRTKRQTERPACQLSLGSKRSEVGRYLTAGYWNRCALQRIFLNDARTHNQCHVDRSNRRGVNSTASIVHRA
jgi:hypothetical protein